jgi:hypothetical protein
MGKSDEHIEQNYFKIIAEDGDIAGVGKADKGSHNEALLIEQLFDLGFKIVKCDKQEYDDFDEEEDDEEIIHITHN